MGSGEGQAFLEAEMVFGLQKIDVRLGLVSLVTMLRGSVEPFVKGLEYQQEFPRDQQKETSHTYLKELL